MEEVEDFFGTIEVNQVDLDENDLEIFANMAAEETLEKAIE